MASQAIRWKPSSRCQRRSRPALLIKGWSKAHHNWEDMRKHVQSEVQNGSKWFKIFKVIKGKWDGESSESSLKSCEILWIKIMLVLSHGNIEPRAPRLACVLVFDLLRFILKNKMCDKTFYIQKWQRGLGQERKSVSFKERVCPQGNQMPACAHETEGTLNCTGTNQRKFPLHALSTKEDKIANMMCCRTIF